MAYRLWVDSPSPTAPGQPRSVLGDFGTVEAAQRAAQDLVDSFLAAAHRPGMTAPELFRTYVLSGEDPRVVASETRGATFSARDYARGRCEEICSQSPDCATARDGKAAAAAPPAEKRETALRRYLDQLLARKRAERDCQIAQARAASANKEPFDMEQLLRLYDPWPFFRGRPSDEVRCATAKLLEYDYYVTYRDVATLGEFALRRRRGELTR